MSNDKLSKLRAAVTPNVPLRMSGATTFVGVGTTGLEVLLEVFRTISEATQCKVPSIARWLTIDADADGRDPDSLTEQVYTSYVPAGKSGAGTVISNGKALAEREFSSIKGELLQAMSGLAMDSDPRFSTLSGARSQSVVIVAGSAGGTSGGTKDLVTTAAHLCSDHLGLDMFDLDIVTICGEMPWRDVIRDVSPEVVARIKANYAESALWRYRQMATHHPVYIDVPGKGRVRMHAGSRLTNNIEFDWESDFAKIQTTEQLIAMMSRCLFQRYFTAAGARNRSRTKDLMVTGVTGQNHPLQYGGTKNEY